MFFVLPFCTFVALGFLAKKQKGSTFFEQCAHLGVHNIEVYTEVSRSVSH